MSLDDIFRFRVAGDLKARFEALARLERRDPSDLARIVFEDYVESKENILRDAPSSSGTGPASKVVQIVKKYPPTKKGSKS